MLGLPGQRPESLADDILLARELKVEMCGVGPFIAQADTPLAAQPSGPVELTLRVMAVLRLALPWVNLPATTALATLAPDTGQAEGLRAGGNVLMPSFTPPRYRQDYRIYDNKNRVSLQEARKAIAAAGRRCGLGEDVVTPQYSLLQDERQDSKKDSSTDCNYTPKTNC